MQNSDLHWALPASIFVSLQLVVGKALAIAIGFAPSPPVLMYLDKAWAMAVFAGLFFVLFETLKMMWQGERRPILQLANLARTSGHKVPLALLGIALVSIQIAALTWLKSMLPIAMPFWADPLLASIDRSVFGTDVGRLIPALPPLAHRLVDVSYLAWFPVKAYALVMLLSLAPSRLKSQALLAYFVTVGLFGVAGQYALSSAGPIFYHLLGYGRDFADLPSSGVAIYTRDYLWSVYLNRHASFGSGISAMPSIHVAVAAWLALTVQRIWHRLAVVGWAYYALIFFGSIYLGWHYASDGVIGTIAALAAWKISGAAVHTLSNRSTKEWASAYA